MLPEPLNKPLPQCSLESEEGPACPTCGYLFLETDCLELRGRDERADASACKLVCTCPQCKNSQCCADRWAEQHVERMSDADAEVEQRRERHSGG